MPTQNVAARVAAEGVRTALHLRTGYLIAENDMPSVCAALASVLDAEYQRGYRAGYDRGQAEGPATSKRRFTKIRGQWVPDEDQD